MSYSIEMVSLEEIPEFVVPNDGTYLVQTKSEYGLGQTKFVNTHFLSTHVNKHYDNKRNKWINTFHCSGKVTHISRNPLK